MGKILEGPGTLPPFQNMAKKVSHLKKRLEAYGIQPEELQLPMKTGKALYFLLRELEMLVLGSLFLLIGLVFNFIPFGLTLLTVRLFTRDEDHWATHYLFLGALFWGLCTVATSAVFFSFNPFLSVAFPILASYFGFFGLRFSIRLMRIVRRFRTFCLFLIRPGLHGKLKEESDRLKRQIQDMYADVSGSE